jgi:predicted nuclease of restriction endonuclease-like (RecB) superfamily
LVSAEKPKLNQIVDTCLLEIGQVFGVVDVSLRVQIPVADFDWMEEFEIRHGGIIVK